jgi:tRNA (guanine-N7-)-methyltransferase
MTKRKLEHFAETAAFENFIQISYDELKNGFHLKGLWNKSFFKNEKPIVLELGCGKGEYTVGLAVRNQEKNYIGIDIKGSRMWRGAKTATEECISNVAFLRTQVNLIAGFFAKDEVSEIWVTFPDPHPRKSKERKRLTSKRFVDIYNKILKQDGIIHLKTDNAALYEYTLEVIKENSYKLLYNTEDLYNSGNTEDVVEIQTFYENKFLELGMPICYLRFQPK